MGPAGARARARCDSPIRSAPGSGLGGGGHRAQQGRGSTSGSQTSPAREEGGRERQERRGGRVDLPPSGVGRSGTPPIGMEGNSTSAKHKFTNFSAWAKALPRKLLEGSSDLSFYFRTCMVPRDLRDFGGPGAAVWPMPPPFDWSIGSPPAGARRRSRWRLHVASRLLTNVAVVALFAFEPW